MEHVVSHRADHVRKEIAITARIPHKSGCTVIERSGRMFLHWHALERAGRPDLNNWEIDFIGLTEAEAIAEKEKIAASYLARGYAIRSNSNFDHQ